MSEVPMTQEVKDLLADMIDQVKEMRAEMAEDRSPTQIQHSELIQSMIAIEEHNGGQPKSAIRDPEFDNDNVIASFTMHDNDFTGPITHFVESVVGEMIKLTDKLTSEEKSEYFRTIWDMTCWPLYYLSTVRAHQIENEDDDKYNPRGWGNKYKTEAYMTKRMRVNFDQNAQEVFNEFGNDGNGEFVFVDHKGVIGWS